MFHTISVFKEGFVSYPSVMAISLPFWLERK